MIPAFSSWSAFWAMGGYGFFVWSAFICALMTFVALWVHTIFRRRQIVTGILREQARRARRAGKSQTETRELNNESAA
ncbi:MAG: Heme exporter protein D [Candidatus Erwinia impunctatus]|nr:Heme exporter protein D [Culicoides impunctatus]